MLLLATFVVILAAPQYPFPQNKQYAFGHIFNPDKKIVEDSLRQKFADWRKKWVVENFKIDNVPTAYIAHTSGKYTLVSSSDITFGMLVSVYMDDGSNGAQTLFNQFLNFYRCNMSKSNNISSCKTSDIQTMYARIEIKDSTSNRFEGVSRTDADMDVALALFLADKQWGSDGSEDYARYAQTLLWNIYRDEVDSTQRLKAYTDFNPAFNTSYSAFANFHVFDAVGTQAKDVWKTLSKNTAEDLFKCQHPLTGLVPHWCAWKTYDAVKVNDSYEERPGFISDAFVVPWRTAMAYYWYGDENAKKFNDLLFEWLYLVSYGHASHIRSYYRVDGSYFIFEGEDSGDASEVDAAGLSFTSTDRYNFYLETVYESLMNMKTKTATAESKRLLELLLLTGNMPNLIHMESLTDIKTQSIMRQPQMPNGMMDSTLKVSGFSNWIIKSNGWNKVNIFPDSTQKPLFADNGRAVAKAEMRVESSVDHECKNGECNDPEKTFVGMALYIGENKEHLDLSDLDTLRITVKTHGAVGITAICECLDDERHSINRWSEMIQPSDSFTTYSFSSGDFKNLFKAKGFSFEPLMAPGGYASIEILDIKLLDKDGKLIKVYDKLGIDTTASVIKTSSLKTDVASMFDVKFQVVNHSVSFSNISNGTKVLLFDMQGRLVFEKRLNSGESFIVPHAGSYLMCVEKRFYSIKIK